VATNDQLALLRAMAEGDFERHEAQSLRTSGGLDNHGTVIGAAFYLAVRRQFERRYRPDDVIRLVADTRAMFDQTGDVIDPRAAELIVRSALGEHGRLSDMPGAKKVEMPCVRRLTGAVGVLAGAVPTSTRDNRSIL